MTDARLRQIGVVLMMLGYFTLVYVDVFAGATFRVVGNSLMMPFAIRHKMWDVVIMASFFLTIDATKALQLAVEYFLS